MKILIIEDDFDIGQVIKMQLEMISLSPILANSAKSAQTTIDQGDVSLFLIDRMLPDKKGLDLCKELRNSPQYFQTPIILITAMSEPENIIEGLESGADDYITKPFDLNILQARVKAQIRRLQQLEFKPTQPSPNVIEYSGLAINLEGCEVRFQEKIIPLTYTEFQLLKELILNPGIVRTRQLLLEKVIGPDVFVTPRTIDTHMAGLRKKLGEGNHLIETVRGVGYRFKPDE